MIGEALMKKKCIIIPAFNEQDHIATVITGIKQYHAADIVVIDDGSKDHTAKNARTAGALVLRHPFNMGYGVALQTGYKFAVQHQYDVLLQMDGDGQHDPKNIPDFFSAMETDEWDVIIGSRFLGDRRYQAGVLKSIGIGLFRYVIRVISGKKITDPTSGYQCMNRKVFTTFTEDSFPCDYPDANIIIMLHRQGFRIKEIPVTMIPNPAGRSMHRGILTKIYYFFKIFLAIFMVLLRGK